MNKTIFDVDDIREIRSELFQEYASMSKDAAKALQNKRIEEELRKIAQLRYITRSVDVCPNDIRFIEEHREQV